MPPHIKTIVKHHLLLNDPDRLYTVEISGNRPNVIPITLAIAGETSNWHNLDFILSDDTGSTRPGRTRRKCIVFHDRVEDAVAAKNFQDASLPPELRRKGVIRHYNSLMSDEYLNSTYDDFRDPDGRCEILHATEAASTV